jgi:biopolymer transport protein ExbD
VIHVRVPTTSLRGVDVSVVPMINIVFLLLLYFLVAGRLTDSSGPALELPEGGGARSPQPATVVVHIDAEGRFVGRGEVLDASGIEAYLRGSDDGAVPHVIVRADARAHATTLHTVMAACRAVGISTFELTTVSTY